MYAIRSYYVRLGVEGFFPIHEAWKFYQPVSFSGGTLSLLFPDAQDIIDSYTSSLDAFVSQEIREKVRITSFNVFYTKLLRVLSGSNWSRPFLK